MQEGGGDAGGGGGGSDGAESSDEDSDFEDEEERQRREDGAGEGEGGGDDEGSIGEGQADEDEDDEDELDPDERGARPIRQLRRGTRFPQGRDLEKIALCSIEDFDINKVEPCYVGNMDVKCSNGCGAYHFKKEENSTGKYRQCCDYGRIRLDKMEAPSPIIQDIFNPNTADGKTFKGNSKQRLYNNFLSAASTKMNLYAFKSTGPQTLRVNGQILHNIGSPIPAENERAKGWMQSFFVDPGQEAQSDFLNRVSEQNLLRRLKNELYRLNPLYRELKFQLEALEEKEREERRPVPDYSLVLSSKPLNKVHKGALNLPQMNPQLNATSEVAGFFIMPKNETLRLFRDEMGERDERLKGLRFVSVDMREQVGGSPLKSISSFYPQYDSVCYSLYHPTGKAGYHDGLQKAPKGELAIDNFDLEAEEEDHETEDETEDENERDRNENDEDEIQIHNNHNRNRNQNRNRNRNNRNNNRNNNSNKLTIMDYYRYRMHTRDRCTREVAPAEPLRGNMHDKPIYRWEAINHDVLFYGGSLSNQYWIDMAIKMEEERLNFIRFNQKALKAETYKGLVDAVAANEHREAGKYVVLPSSFKGVLETKVRIFKMPWQS